MKKVIVNEKERGLMFVHGKFTRLLSPGKYTLWRKDTEIEIVSLDSALISKKCPVDVLLKNKEIAGQTDVVEVKEGEYVFRFANGVFQKEYCPGKYAFWNIGIQNDFVIADITKKEIAEDFPKHILRKIPPALYQTIVVQEYEKCVLYYNGKFEKVLEPGTYYFWNNHWTLIGYHKLDMRLLNMSVNGQDVLTLDKVSIRVNLTLNYKITDCVSICNNVENYREQLHIIAQMALRDFVGKYKLDEILTSKNEMSEFVLKRCREKEKELFVEIKEAGVKDIILPGEIREIMNTVLIAEKKAQASVITRREEVASTRSLLNTAKLMDENKTLYRLKELEYIEKICENVGNISLNGSGDILSLLTGMMQKTAERSG